MTLTVKTAYMRSNTSKYINVLSVNRTTLTLRICVFKKALLNARLPLCVLYFNQIRYANGSCAAVAARTKENASNTVLRRKFGM